MSNQRMPVIFSGHGSPMLALENSKVTKGLNDIGNRIIEKFGKPKAILGISAHWYVKGTFVQSTETPEQVYDMYGFPHELYEFKYPVKGDIALAERVSELLGDMAAINNEWGIDHGIWTVLCHVFPNADIPVVQLSVDKTLTKDEMYHIGRSLVPLRDKGYLIFASGNVVHNLRRVEWENPNGTEMTERFNQYIIDKINNSDENAVMNYETHPDAAYAVPTPDHYLPLIYSLGSADGDKAEVFNNICNLGSMAMTGFAFGI